MRTSIPYFWNTRLASLYLLDLIIKLKFPHGGFLVLLFGMGMKLKRD
jgi:hypothetical protein